MVFVFRIGDKNMILVEHSIQKSGTLEEFTGGSEIDSFVISDKLEKIFISLTKNGRAIIRSGAMYVSIPTSWLEFEAIPYTATDESLVDINISWRSEECSGNLILLSTKPNETELEWRESP